MKTVFDDNMILKATGTSIVVLKEGMAVLTILPENCKNEIQHHMDTPRYDHAYVIHEGTVDHKKCHIIFITPFVNGESNHSGIDMIVGLFDDFLNKQNIIRTTDHHIFSGEAFFLNRKGNAKSLSELALFNLKGATTADLVSLYENEDKITLCPLPENCIDKKFTDAFNPNILKSFKFSIPNNPASVAVVGLFARQVASYSYFNEERKQQISPHFGML